MEMIQVDAVMMYNDVYQGNWSGHEYLNVFVCGAVGSGIAGYTYYPSGWFGTSMSNGIWLRHDYCGSIGTGSLYRSRTFIHEVGHWLIYPTLGEAQMNLALHQIVTWMMA